ESGDLALFHRFEDGRLCLWRRAVDLVGQDEMREDRSLLELEIAPAVGFREHLRADDIRRHEIGRELHALERKPQSAAERLDEQRFAEAGRAFEQHVTAGEKRDQHFADDIRVADDDFFDLRLDAAEDFFEFGWVHRYRMRPRYSSGSICFSAAA